VIVPLEEPPLLFSLIAQRKGRVREPNWKQPWYSTCRYMAINRLAVVAVVVVVVVQLYCDIVPVL
jgi:hypothetical protein